jgi:hypothetical protein
MFPSFDRHRFLPAKFFIQNLCKSPLKRRLGKLKVAERGRLPCLIGVARLALRTQPRCHESPILLMLLGETSSPELFAIGRVRSPIA